MEYPSTIPDFFSRPQINSKTPPAVNKPNDQIKVLGLASYTITHNGERYVGKHSALFNTLAQHYNLVDVGSIQVDGWQKWQQRATYFHPNRSVWVAASHMNVMAFRERSRRAEKFIQSHEGNYDFIFQLHTQMSPGLKLETRPYVLATDNTYMLSERYWADWVPVKRERAEWIAHETEVYQNATYIFTWSEFARQSMIRDYGIHPRRVIATGSAGGFQIEPEPKDDFSKPIALFVGNDFERKGGFILLKAWEQVRRQIPNAELHIVGPQQPMAEAQPGVNWMGRISDRTELRSVFQQASVFVLPSLFEPFAMALLEGMGFGLPGIGAKSGGIPEMIIDGYSGLLVEPGDTTALAEAIVKVLSNPEMAKTMGRNAHKIAKEQFSWDAIVARMSGRIQEAFAGEAITVPSRSRDKLAAAVPQ